MSSQLNQMIDIPRTRPVSKRSVFKTRTFGSLLLSLGLALGGCGSSESGVDGTQGGSGLTPVGVQDYGLFKSILTAGQLPGPETLDQVGFFAEHKIGTPPTSCAGTVCTAAELGSMANMISGSGCTLIRLAFGTPLDPQSLPRPAVDVAVIAEDSIAGSSLTEGLRTLINGLEDSDTISLLGDGQLLADHTSGAARAALAAKVGTFQFGSGSALYDQLRLAMDTLGPALAGRHRRVILLSSGLSVTTDSLSRDRAGRLGQSFAEGGGGISVIEMSSASNAAGGVFLKNLADQSAAVFYHVSSPSELPDLFKREIEYSLIPVATQVKVQLRAGSSWQLREAFGISPRSVTLASQQGQIDIAALTVAWRKTASGSGADRRGGGGGLFVEVLPRLTADPRERPSTVADLDVSYTLPGVPGRQAQTLKVVSQDGPGELLPSGRFASPAVEKGFVVLNLYVALRMAAQRTQVGDLSGAYGILANVDDKVRIWETSHPDPEIRDDLGYVKRFMDLLVKNGADQQPRRSGWFNEPWPRD